MNKYKCSGCGKVHNDNDYSKEDGDVLIKEFNLSERELEELYYLKSDVKEYIKILKECPMEVSWIDWIEAKAGDKLI
jgi:hypothetical protein